MENLILIFGFIIIINDSLIFKITEKLPITLYPFCAVECGMRDVDDFGSFIISGGLIILYNGTSLVFDINKVFG